MSAGEIVLILFVYLLFFGAKGLPSLAQTMGKAVYQFRNATQDIQREIMQGANEVRKQADVKLDQISLEDETPAAPQERVIPPPPPPSQEFIDK
jgi:TatA/E family protein of Tat protein translocase